MANLQKDPLQSITLALQPIFSGFGIKSTQLGWPDTKFFSVDGNLPTVAIVQVGGNSKHQASRQSVHAVVNNGDGTSTAFYEQERLFLLLQISLFTNTPQDRSDIGWSIQQYLVSNPQLQIGIPGVETSVFKLKGIPRDSEGETNFYQRDITFEATARVLDAETAQTATRIVLGQNVDSDQTAPLSTSNPQNTTAVNIN
jgi:hypothetical protein